MKKSYRILGIVAALLVCQLNAAKAFADNIDVQSAQKLAAKYMVAKTGEKSLTAADMSLVYQIDNEQQGIPALYFFNSSNGGFLVMSASNCMDPVLAYSTESYLDPTHMAPAMLWFMNQYAQNISMLQNEGAEPEQEVLRMWEDLAAGRVQADDPKTIYKTLRCVWDQDYPYNTLTPMVNELNSSGNTTGRQVHAPVGCVATAMSMIVQYWKYPVKPTGSKRYYWNGSPNGTVPLSLKYDTIQYNYDLMPDTAYRGFSSLTMGTMWLNDEQIREVSRLSWHCGIANNMDYGYDGSGALSGTYTQPAFTDYYKYDKDSIIALDRKSGQYYNSSCATNPNAKDTAWADRLGKEIMAKRPVFYSAHDNGSTGVHAGHAFVLERFKDNTKEGYFNWGWGHKGGNCWCNMIKAQLSAGGYNFSSSHWALGGIQPPRDTLEARGFYEGIEMVGDVQMLPVYPNPTSEWVNVPYMLPSNATEAQLQVYSLDGRLMHQRTVYSHNMQACVNVSSYPKGMYICRIGNVTRKFVVE